MGTWPNVLHLFSTYVSNYIFMLVLCLAQGKPQPSWHQWLCTCYYGEHTLATVPSNLSTNLLDNKTCQLSQTKISNGDCIKVRPQFRVGVFRASGRPAQRRIRDRTTLLHVYIQRVPLKRPYLQFQMYLHAPSISKNRKALAKAPKFQPVQQNVFKQFRSTPDSRTAQSSEFSDPELRRYIGLSSKKQLMQQNDQIFFARLLESIKIILVIHY